MKRSGLLALLSLSVLFLASCAPRTDSTAKANLEATDLPVMCKAGADCDEMWGRAGLWVAQHSTLKITAKTASLIRTQEPLGLDSHAGFTVSKTLDNDDIYNIKFTVICNNWFGCTPSTPKAKTDFANFVTATVASNAKPRLGIRVHPMSATTARAKGIQDTHGVVAVVKVTPKSVADKLGIQLGDIIVQYDGKSVATEAELRELVASTPQDQKINILIYRDKNEKTLKANM